MIDPLKEELLTLNQARLLFPCRRRGKRVDLSCLYRWTSKGVRGVVLESVQVGGTRCTSRKACARFIYRLSVADSEASVPRSLPDSQRASDGAEKELDRLGI